MMREKAVVIVSPYFPPSTLSGVHRARHLAKHLPRVGWRPIIVCVDERHYGQSLDWELAALVPPSTEVVKVEALPLSVTRPFGIGDISLRAWAPLRKAVFRLASSRRIDAVMFTAAPYYPLLIAPGLKRRFNLPVIIDFQDPWVSAWGALQPPLSKAGLSHRLAELLEPRVVRAADFVTSVSERQNQEMRERYPWLSAEYMDAIAIGGDLDDFRGVAAASPSRLGGLLNPTKLNVSFIGTLAPRADELVQQVMEALASLRLKDPDFAARLQLNFLGTSGSPDDESNFRIRPFARAAGVDEMVNESPRRLPYVTALAAMKASEGLLLIGSDEPHYTASKIYPVLMSGRPYVSLYHGASSGHRILSEAGGGLALSWPGAEGRGHLVDRLAESLRIVATSGEELGTANPASYADYDGPSIARHYADAFDIAVARHGSRARSTTRASERS